LGHNPTEAKLRSKAAKAQSGNLRARSSCQYDRNGAAGLIRMKIIAAQNKQIDTE
jgi:hypothetical protein